MTFETRLADYFTAHADPSCASRRGCGAGGQKLFPLWAMEFYWTVTRLLGLGYLHDGSRKPEPKLRRPWAAPSYANLDKALAPPRVLVDVTATYRSGEKTGIQRVVREIANSAFRSGDGLPVIIKEGRLYPLYDHPALHAPIRLAEGDKFLMLDATWGMVDEYGPMMCAVREAGGETVVGVHDIIPLLFPICVTPAGQASFREWFERVPLAADAIVCVSRWSAESFIDYVRAHRCPHKPEMPVGWWRLGADFHPGRLQWPSFTAAMIAAQKSPLFLSVGTLDLRKAYAIGVDAFDRLWARGVDVRYAIVGRAGWQSAKFEARLKSHREWGRRLFWLAGASDADLRHLYRNSRALIFSSIAEGFGLPLVEANFHGLPVIASDLPNFRELCGEAAHYFAPLDPDALACAVESVLARPKLQRSGEAYSWRQSTDALMEIVRGGNYQARV